MLLIHRFFSGADGRIRAGWRLLFQALLAVLLMIPFQLVASHVGGRQLQIISGGMAVVLAVWVAGWMLDRRPLHDFGLKIDQKWWKDLGTGFLLAAVVMSLLVGISWIAGWVEFRGFGWNRSGGGSFLAAITGYVATMAVVGFYEELWARGYLLKNLTEGFYFGGNPAVAALMAMAISSLIFGVLHMGNPHAGFTGIMVIVLAGIMLAMPYVITGQLGFSVGLHFAWNAVQGAVFGLPVSGIPFRHSLFQFYATGPEVWTGGRFGPEGGLAGLLGVILLIGLTGLWLKWNGYTFTVAPDLVRPPSFAKVSDRL